MSRSLFLASGLTLALGALASAITYTATLLPVFHDVASVVRMPVPGSRDVTLDARRYALYFGLSNAPTHRLRAPALKITIVPPRGVADPDFVEEHVSNGSDSRVEGYFTEQVATVTVFAPGKYHIQVKSPDESGGSFSVGESPSRGDPDTAFVRALVVGIACFLASMGLLLVGLTRRRRGVGRPSVG